MSNLNFIEIKNEVINIGQISNIIYDDKLNNYTIIMRNNIRHVVITPEEYRIIKEHLKSISNSFLIV